MFLNKVEINRKVTIQLIKTDSNLILILNNKIKTDPIKIKVIIIITIAFKIKKVREIHFYKIQIFMEIHLKSLNKKSL